MRWLWLLPRWAVLISVDPGVVVPDAQRVAASCAPAQLEEELAMMNRVFSPIAGLVVIGMLGVGVVFTDRPAAAQVEWPWCNNDVAAPDDDFESAAVGLTKSELAERYGPSEEVQDGTHYQSNGYVLVAENCDIIVKIGDESPYRDREAAHQLAQSLLPADAILVGFWALGNPMGMGDVPPRDAEEWISGSLAGRYRLLGEARSGSILVYYYLAAKDDPNQPIQFDMVERIELRTAQVPRVLATPTP